MKFRPMSRLLRTALRASLAVAIPSIWCQSTWAQRDLKEIPQPNPVAESAAMQVDPTLEVELFASDPAITKPIHMNFDPLGRLWVASSATYPQLAPGEVANDQIQVLEDTDGDGKADKNTIFADQLLIPTGVLPDIDGRSAYVAASTQLLYLSDTDGDGKADSRRIVLSGFGTEDTHHLLHTLRWGPDGWLYMNQSIYIHSHVETPYGTKHLDGGGIWRYHPPTQRLEVVCKGFVNPWGHVFDRAFQQFATDGAYGEGVNYVFPGSVFVTSPGAERWLSGLNPGSPKHCGLERISGNHFPPQWSGQMIANDFRSHRVCRFQVQRNEEGYTSQQQPEVIRSEHIAFRPIDAKMGPDGALYIADWYNPIIQHGEVDFRDDRRDRIHGRVWRVRCKDRPLSAYRFNPNAPIEALVASLDDPLELTRQWARLALARHPWQQVAPALDRWVASEVPADSSNGELPWAATRQLEKLYVSEACGQWDQSLAKQLMKHPEPRVRAGALRLAGWNLDSWNDPMPSLQQAVVDADWQVRLEGVVALRRQGSPEALSLAMQVLDRPMHPAIDFALWSFLRESEGEWTTAIADGKLPWMSKPQALVFASQAARGGALAKWLGQHLSEVTNDVDGRRALLEAIAAKGDPQDLSAALTAITQEVQKQQVPIDQLDRWMPALWDASSRRNAAPDQAADLLGKFREAAQKQTDPNLTDRIDWLAAMAAGKWNVAGLQVSTAQWLSSALDRLPPERIAAVLDGFPGSKNEPWTALLEQAFREGKTPAIRSAAIGSLAKLDLGAAATRLAETIAGQTEPLDAATIPLVAARQGGPEALVAALEKVEQWPTDSARIALESLQKNSIQNPALLDAIRRIGKMSDQRWEYGPKLLEEISQLAASQADPHRGEALYRRSSLQCSRCHPIGTAGGQIGPNLVSLGGSSQLDYILESILSPDARLKEGFQTIVVLTDSGEVISGLEQSRSDEALQLLTAEGKVVRIPRDSIEEEKVGKSLMPAGLVDTLSKAQLADLVRFLSELGRTPEFTISTQPWIRRWEALQHTPEGNQLLNRTSLDSMATDQKVLQWSPIVTLVNGKVPLGELAKYQPHGNMKPFVAFRSQLNCKQGGELQLHVEGVKEWKSWWDGKPIDLVASGGKIKIEPGNHQLILAIDAGQSDQAGVWFEGTGDRPAAVEAAP